MRKSKTPFNKLIISPMLAVLSISMIIFSRDNDYKKEDKNMNNKKYKEAVFAGGCFWCSEYSLEYVPGVIEVISGYTGGKAENPTYKDVSQGKTGHFEAVKVKYDPAETSYEKLLEAFFKHIDPTDPDGQFYDKGSQYRTAIFYDNKREEALAWEAINRLEGSGLFEKKIATKVLPAKEFYPAEDYHQDYYKKCPLKFQSYHKASGREDFKSGIWDWAGEFSLFPLKQDNRKDYQKPDKSALKNRLNNLQYGVTQQCQTEPPFNNRYWNNHKEGIYVDIVSGEVLFSSHDKFDSKTGWPSFTKPLEPENILNNKDTSHGMNRTEVKSRQAGSHLGHVFSDGPPPTGLRYCINSASLKFIPKEDLEKEGYGEYLELFK